MASPSYELAGPFNESGKANSGEHVISHTVKLRAERNSPHPLNPVGQLRRVVSNQHVVQEAILLLGLQFFEIFTVVHERQEAPRNRGTQLRDRIKSVATGHLPKRLRRDTHDEDAAEELRNLPPVFSESDFGGMESMLKDHVFSCGVAFAQIVSIRSRGNSITVYYHPNSMKSAKLSKHNLATAMRFTFCLDSPEETTKLLKELEKRMARYTQAAQFLGEEWVLPSALHIVAVTRPLPEQETGDLQQKAELLLAKDPPWGVKIPAPSSWSLESADSDTPLWVFLMTPLGYGKCEISPADVSLYRKGRTASFYVGVRHPQVSGSALATVSQLQQIRPTYSTGDDDEAENLDGDESDDSWQPADAEESFTGPDGASMQRSASRAPDLSVHGRSASSSLQRSSASVASRRQESLSRVRLPSGHGVAGKHVRVHCLAEFSQAGEGKQATSSATTGFALPGGVQLTTMELGAFALATLLLLWLSSSVSQLLLWLGLQLGLLHYLRRQQPLKEESPALLRTLSVANSQGLWHVTLLRAEIVTDEPWSAAGESIMSQVATDDSEESAEARKQRLAEEYGFTEDVVHRYILAFHGDEVTAHRKMRATYEWKKENKIEGILRQPQPNFEFFKRMFRHGLLGVSKGGHPVWFMKIGDMKQGFRTFKDSGLSNRDLARHVALCLDYMYTVVEAAPLPEGRALWVLDLKGMGLTDMGSDAFEMGKEIAGIISAHWPERLYRAFIINMPGFFSILWRLVEPMLAASTRKKIRLLRGKQAMLQEMLEEMEIQDIPSEYGGKLEGDIYSGKTEKEFWKFVGEIEGGKSAD